MESIENQSQLIIDEVLMEAMTNLNETQEKVEAAYNEFLRLKEHAEELINLWINELRQAETSERMPFLYLSNHILHNKDILRFQPYFENHLEEAVSLVCNHPGNRSKVGRLLSIWKENGFFSPHFITKLWEATGELDEEMNNLETNGPNENSSPSEAVLSKRYSVNSSNFTKKDNDNPSHVIHTDLLHNIVSHVKAMDRNRGIIHFLENRLNEKNCDLPKLSLLAKHISSPQDILAYLKEEEKLSPRHTSSDTELRSTKLRVEIEQAILSLNVLMKKYENWKNLEESLSKDTSKLIAMEKEERNGFDLKIENCDEMDIAISDLNYHRESFPIQWEFRAQKFRTEKRKRDEEVARKAELVRLRQEESAKKAKEALQNDHESRSQEPLNENTHAPVVTDKKGKESTMVWHPVLKELVEVPSNQMDSEDWRDH